MTAQSLNALPHNYTTKAPMVTMGRPNFTPKTAPSPSTITTPSNPPIPRPTPFTNPNDIRIQSAVLPQYTLRTDRQTDRPVEGPGECSVNMTAPLAMLIDSDAPIITTRKLSYRKDDRAMCLIYMSALKVFETP